MPGEVEVQQLAGRVAELESKVDFLIRHLGVDYVRPVGEGEQKVLDILRQSGNMIEAIKVYREIFGADLAGAKKAVEDLRAAHP